MPETIHAPVLIIGSGPAGYTAAIYAARANLKPVLVAGMQQGGQLTITSDVENYPGYADPVQGPWMMEQMRLQSVHVGTDIRNDIIISVDLSVRPFTAVGDTGTIYSGDALIIATGAQAKWLGIPSEKAYMGFGVSACATCDGFFYRNKDVVVIGGGNSAVEEALYLSNIARHVTVVHRRDTFRAEKIQQDRLFAKDNVTVRWNTVVDEIIGAKGSNPALPATVNAIRLKSTETGVTKDLPCDGIFVAIGHAPAVSLFEGKLKQKPNGYLWTAPDSTVTSLPGVFAAGDVTDDIYRQAVTAAGLGCMAALEAERWLSLQETMLEAVE